MQRKLLFILSGFMITFHFLSASANKDNINTEIFNFTGLIGKDMPVSFHLEKKGDKISGFYYYEKWGVDILLDGISKGDIFELYELDYNGNRKAMIVGEFSNSRFIGKWQEIGGKTEYTLDLKPTPHLLEAIPDNIAGVYKAIGCTLELSITKVKGLYNYVFKTGDKSDRGSLLFFREFSEQSEQNNRQYLYIILPNYKWSECLGDIKNMEDYAGQSKDMYGLELLWDGDGFSFQNGGNAMNYYVIVDTCDKKFIDLHRVDPYEDDNENK